MMPGIPFNPPPVNLKPADGEVHVFCIPLDQRPARLEQLAKTLSEDERLRAGNFHFGNDRNRFIAGRGMLRDILGWLLGVEPADLIFSYGDHGKPRLAAPAAKSSLHFNMAHSGSLAVYAISPTYEVGIDVERIRPIREAADIAAHFFSEEERAKWRSLPEDARMEAFFNCWVRKEAVLKACGKGIGASLNQIEVFFDGDFLSGAQFSLRSLSPAFNYAAAVAARCRDLRVSCWRSLQDTFAMKTQPS
jgi:4'-phosphopantetheinyl transferase